jgi:hypothetical protein
VDGDPLAQIVVLVAARMLARLSAEARRMLVEKRGSRRPSSQDARSAAAVLEPHLRLATLLDRIARRVDRIENRLLLVEIGTVDRHSDSNHPTLFASLTADPKLDGRHSRCS